MRLNKTLEQVSEALAESGLSLNIVGTDNKGGHIEYRPFDTSFSLIFLGFGVFLIARFIESFVTELGKITAIKTGERVDKSIQKLSSRLAKLNKSLSRKRPDSIKEENLEFIESLISNQELSKHKFSGRDLECACVVARQIIVDILKKQGLTTHRSEAMGRDITTYIYEDIVKMLNKEE